MTTPIFITGASGQLGGEIKRLFPDAIYLTRNEVDLSNPISITEYFQNKNPEIIVNCGAYTSVDLAEKEKEVALNCNSVSPGILAGFAKKFIHFSTDYVFNGEGYRPYLEDYSPSPVNFYGHTKLLGEEAVLRANPNSVIIRTSWVYSDIGKNFVKTILKFGQERDLLKIVWDQLGTPTYASDLAKVVVENGLKEWKFNSGIYHYSNEGVASWYDFAKEIFYSKGLSCKVLPIRSEEFPTPAKRPHYSVLDKSKIKHDLGIEIPHWKESLRICLSKLS